MGRSKLPTLGLFLMVIFLILTLFSSLAPAEIINLPRKISGSYYILTLKYSGGDISLKNVEVRDGGFSIRDSKGDYRVSLVSADGRVLFKTYFNFHLSLFAESFEGCLNGGPGQLDCGLTKVDLPEDVAVLYIPRVPNSKFIQIYNNRGYLLLDVDLENVYSGHLEHDSCGVDTDCDGAVAIKELFGAVDYWMQSRLTTLKLERAVFQWFFE